MTSPRLSSVAVGIVLIFAVLVAQAQEPIALRCEPGGKGWKSVYGLCFSADSRWLAAGMYDRIVVWDVTTQETAANLPVPRLSVTSLAFSPDGQTLVAGLRVGSVRIWDGRQGWADARETDPIEAPVINRPKPRNLPEEREPVQHVAFCGDGEVLAWSSAAPTADHKVHFWKWPAREEMVVLPIGPAVGDRRFQLRGNQLTVIVATSRRPRSRGNPILGHRREKLIRTLSVSVGAIGGHRFSPDGKLLAGNLEYGRQPAELVVWDLATGKSVSFGRGPHQWLRSQPSRRTDHAGRGDVSNPPPPCPSTILLFDVATGRQRDAFRSPRAGTAPWELAFSPDGQYLAAGMHFDEVPVICGACHRVANRPRLFLQADRPEWLAGCAYLNGGMPTGRPA